MLVFPVQAVVVQEADPCKAGTVRLRREYVSCVASKGCGSEHGNRFAVRDKPRCLFVLLIEPQSRA